MLKLVIGNKNYSSWSMRPWLALRANNIPFEEIFVPLYTDQADKDRILGFSKAGKVPTLIDGDVTVWDSLAIIEYLAEKFPEAKLWPADRAARAHARAISAEMHSGFVPLRSECGMNLHRPIKAVALSNDARANVARIEEIAAVAFGHGPRRLIGKSATLAPATIGEDVKFPKVSIHIPAYFEPVEMLKQTLDAVSRLDYPNFECVCIINNTPDPEFWRPIQDHCRQLGERFKFINAEKVQGFKAGALRIAMERTAADAEIIGIIDADYVEIGRAHV